MAITGASAIPLAKRSLQLLLENNYDVYLIVSKGAYHLFQAEYGITLPVDIDQQTDFWRKELKSKKGNLRCFKWNDNAAPIASGSFNTSGMLIIPCSMGTLGRIASGVSLDLIQRTADVHLKERRKLVIVPREMPWNLIHLRNMSTLVEAGAYIAPPIPAWYSKPNTMDDMIDFMLSRIFDCFNMELISIDRWKG